MRGRQETGRKNCNERVKRSKIQKIATHSTFIIHHNKKQPELSDPDFFGIAILKTKTPGTNLGFEKIPTSLFFLG
jgi:hypothetical protein